MQRSENEKLEQLKRETRRIEQLEQSHLAHLRQLKEEEDRRIQQLKEASEQRFAEMGRLKEASKQSFLGRLVEQSYVARLAEMGRLKEQSHVSGLAEMGRLKEEVRQCDSNRGELQRSLDAKSREVQNLKTDLMAKMARIERVEQKYLDHKATRCQWMGHAHLWISVARLVQDWNFIRHHAQNIFRVIWDNRFHDSLEKTLFENAVARTTNVAERSKFEDQSFRWFRDHTIHSIIIKWKQYFAAPPNPDLAKRCPTTPIPTPLVKELWTKLHALLSDPSDSHYGSDGLANNPPITASSKTGGLITLVDMITRDSLYFYPTPSSTRPIIMKWQEWEQKSSPTDKQRWADVVFHAHHTGQQLIEAIDELSLQLGPATDMADYDRFLVARDPLPPTRLGGRATFSSRRFNPKLK